MLSIRLLGQFSLALDDNPLSLPSRPAQSLLAWLVLHPGVAYRRERLAGLFWPDATEENAQNNLRHALWRLRRAIPEECAQTDRISIRWVVESDWRLDAATVSAASTDATHADELIPALQMYGGELLPGFYDDWVTLERERLAAFYAERMARLLELLLAEQRWRETIDWAEKWIAQGSTPEQGYRALMTAHASLGDTPAALTAYQRCVDALERELDVPPSAETTALADSIRNSQFAIHHSPFPSSLPPVLPSSLPSNLPAPTTPLIGRDAELTQLAGLLADPAHRLVTIVGPGGMGKSRLALAAAHAQRESFADGVFVVELTALNSADEIPRAVGASLAYTFQTDPRPPRQQLLDYLRNRKLLLLLDNFEHLLDGVDFLMEMLEAAPGLRLLVTSRERLRLHAESIVRLDGLACPRVTGDTRISPQDYGALHLFVKSVQRTIRDYAPSDEQWPAITRICRLVDGMPLGIVLAASWIEHLPPAEIADEIAANIAFLGQELNDLHPRHRTIEAVFEQSWRRLTGAEQQALKGLSLFAGGFDREAAQAVAAATLPILTRLVDKALLWRVGDRRYDLHELVRQLAHQKLANGGEDAALRALHSRWFLGLVARQEKRLKGAEQEQAILLLEQERENARTAWLWAVQNGEIDPMQRAVEALGIFHNRPGQWQEGEALLGRAVAALGQPVGASGQLLLAWLWAWHGVFLHRVGKVESAQEEMAWALNLLEDASLAGVDVRSVQALIYLHRGGSLMADRRRGETGENLRRALALYQAADDGWWTVHCLITLGHWELFNGQMQQGEEKFRQARRIAQQLGNHDGESAALSLLSFVNEHMGRPQEGEGFVRAAIALSQDDGHITQLRQRLAFNLLALGRFEESISESQSALAWYERMGVGARQIQFYFNTLARGYIHVGRFAEGRAQAQYAVDQWQEVYGREHPFLVRGVAMALLGMGEARESLRLMRQTVESHQQWGNDNAFPLGGAFVDCAYPFLAIHDLDGARATLRQGLGLIQYTGAYRFTIQALPAVGVLLAAHERLGEAAYVYGLIQRYPYLTNSRWYAVIALDRLSELLAPLPVDARAAAEERGRAQTLPEITAALLALLESREELTSPSVL